MNKLRRQIFASAGKIQPEYVIKNVNIVNVFTKEIIFGNIGIQDGKIIGIGDYFGKTEFDGNGKYVCPGLIDSHVHIESSMVSPLEFSKTVLKNGTTSVIADPHEIANVSGLDGIEFMLQNSENIPMNIYYMLPSCVPATSFENSGTILEAKDLEKFINHERVLGIGEVMNYPSVINADRDILLKINLGKKNNKVIDGHSPHLTGEDLNAYRVAGIETDHECTTPEEALERIRIGMYVQIREGSAARNAKNILTDFIKNKVDLSQCVLCTDDRHLEDIFKDGHINYIIKLAIKLGLDPVSAICMGTINSAKCYGLKNKGAIAPSYDADLILLDNLDDFKINSVMVNGKWIVEDNILNESLFSSSKFPSHIENSFHMKEVSSEDFKINLDKNQVNVIQIIHKEIETNLITRSIDLEKGAYKNNIDDNILKIAVIERHKDTGNIGLGLIEGFNFKNGAIAQSIAHDSHNLLVIGDNDLDMSIAANHIKNIHGGITIVSNGKILETLALPISGLMSKENSEFVLEKLEKLNSMAKEMGVAKNVDPFLTLGFMALPVIPHIRITDRGLFDVKKFQFIDLE